MTSTTTPGREPITYVEIDQDFCAQTYGTAPCHAQVRVTGERRCYNTLATCQWRSAWTRTIKTLRFTDVQGAPDPFAIPSVVDVTTAPTVINPGGGGARSGPLGQRASVAITFQDHPDTDSQTDPYYDVGSQASSNALTWRERGTFWTKWLARNPYHVNRIVRIRTGYIGQALPEFVTRTYLIDRIDGPDPSGRVVLRAKDMLRLADDNKATMPEISPGMLIDDVPASGGASYLRVTGAAAGHYWRLPLNVRVGREVFSISSITTINANEIRLNISARGQYNTEQKAHRAGDRVQMCYTAVDLPINHVVAILLSQAGVSFAYMDTAKWLAERNEWLSAFNVSGIVTEPTGIRQLLAELSEQCQFLLWWDERQQQVRFEALKPLDGLAVARLTDAENIVADSVRSRADPRSRASQVWVFYGLEDPTARLDDDNNYQRILVHADLDAESESQYGEPVIYKIHSRWITTEAHALNTATRTLNRRRDPPRTITVDVDAKDRDLWTGDVVDMTHRGIVNIHGDPAQRRYQIISAEDVEPGHRIRYELESYEFELGVRSAFWQADNAPAYADATPTEKARGAWWAEADGTVGGDPGYNWV